MSKPVAFYKSVKVIVGGKEVKPKKLKGVEAKLEKLCRDAVIKSIKREDAFIKRALRKVGEK